MTLDLRTLLMGLICMWPGNTVFPGGGLHCVRKLRFDRWEPRWRVLNWIGLIFGYLTVFRDCWNDTEDGLPVDVDVALPEMLDVVFAGTAAVPVSLPVVAGAVLSAVFAGGVAADAAPPADGGTVTVGVTVLTDTGSELPAEL